MSTPALPTAQDIDVIFSDVDGTLLQSDHTLHPRTTKALLALRKSYPSLPIVICSGKAYVSCLDLRQQLQLPDDFPAAHCNGGAIHRGKDGALHSLTSMPAADVVSLANGRMRHHAVFLFMASEAFLVNDEAAEAGKEKKDWVALASQYDANVSDHSSDEKREVVLSKVASGELKVVKMTIGASPSHVTEIYEDLQKAALSGDAVFSVTRAIDIILEILPLGMNKSIAVKQICELLGTTPARAMAFGDGDNDKEMLAAVGYGVSMANAMPPTRKAAKYSTLSNDEGGVGAFIEQVFRQ